MGPNGAHDEVQRMDFEWNERVNPAIGTSNARAKPVDTKSVTEAYLSEGWYDDQVVYEEEINEKGGWNAHTVRLQFHNHDTFANSCNRPMASRW